MSHASSATSSKPSSADSRNDPENLRRQCLDVLDEARDAFRQACALDEASFKRDQRVPNPSTAVVCEKRATERRRKVTRDAIRALEAATEEEDAPRDLQELFESAMEARVLARADLYEAKLGAQRRGLQF